MYESNWALKNDFQMSSIEFPYIGKVAARSSRFSRQISMEFPEVHILVHQGFDFLKLLLKSLVIADGGLFFALN